MPLTCSCYDDYEYYFIPDDDFTTYHKQRGKRCQSCRKIVRFGMEVLKMHCYTYDENGDEKEMAAKYLCSRCAHQYFALEELGFCITLGDSMQELVNEYNVEYVNHGKENKSSEGTSSGHAGTNKAETRSVQDAKPDG